MKGVPYAPGCLPLRGQGDNSTICLPQRVPSAPHLESKEKVITFVLVPQTDKALKGSCSLLANETTKDKTGGIKDF